MSDCCDHCSDEDPWMCECTQKRMEQLQRELTEAHSKLRQYMALQEQMSCELTEAKTRIAARLQQATTPPDKPDISPCPGQQHDSPLWKQWPHCDCPDCGDGTEILTICTGHGEAVDCDPIRCSNPECPRHTEDLGQAVVYNGGDVGSSFERWPRGGDGKPHRPSAVLEVQRRGDREPERDPNGAEPHLCDTCCHDCATCDSDRIVWGIDRYTEAMGAQADKVLECSNYKRNMEAP